jgi:hypothetical protein
VKYIASSAVSHKPNSTLSTTSTFFRGLSGFAEGELSGVVAGGGLVFAACPLPRFCFTI